MSPATIIVAIVVIIAVAYFIRHVRGLFNGTAGCCAAARAAARQADSQRRGINRNSRLAAENK